MHRIFVVFLVFCYIPLIYNCAVSHTGSNNLNTATSTTEETTTQDYYEEETTVSDTTTTSTTTAATTTTTTTTTLKPCTQCDALIHTMNGAGSIDFTETNYVNVDTGCSTIIIECSTTVAGETVSFYYEGDPTADTINLASIERVLTCDENNQWQSPIAGGAVTSIECISK